MDTNSVHLGEIKEFKTAMEETNMKLGYYIFESLLNIQV